MKLYEFFDVPKKKCKMNNKPDRYYSNILYEDGKESCIWNNADRNFIEKNGFNYIYSAHSVIRQTLRNNFENEVIALIDTRFVKIALVKCRGGYKIYSKTKTNEIGLSSYACFDINKMEEDDFLKNEDILEIKDTDEYEKFKKSRILSKLVGDKK